MALAGVMTAAVAAQRGGGSPPMMLTSTAFADGSQIPAKYTQADQVSPALAWTNTPPNTVSFVLHMHDLEVARNRTTDDQVHWTAIRRPTRILFSL